MRRILNLLMSVTLAGLTAIVVAGETGTARPDRTAESEVWQVIEQFNRAFAANDSRTYFRFIADDITVLTPANPYRVEGIGDDREEFEYGLQQGYGRIGYFQEMQPRIDIFGEVAVVTYFSRGFYGPADKARTLYLKETDVLVRRDGQWRIVHIHVSATPPG